MRWTDDEDTYRCQSSRSDCPRRRCFSPPLRILPNGGEATGVCKGEMEKRTAARAPIYRPGGVRLARPAVAGGIRRAIRASCCARTGWLVGSWAQWLTSIPQPREQRLTSGPKCKRASVRWSVGCAGEIPWWAELVFEAQVRFSFPFFPVWFSFIIILNQIWIWT
jgi:hypothetical protein